MTEVQTKTDTRPPLEGVRIISVEQFGAGPWGTMMLADLGAEILKIENPETGGDVARYVPPYTVEKDSVYFQSFNRNKKKSHPESATPRHNRDLPPTGLHFGRRF